MSASKSADQSSNSAPVANDAGVNNASADDFLLRLQSELDNRRQKGLYRQSKSLLTSQSSHVSIANEAHSASAENADEANQSLLNFSSNDYLGLANSTVAKQALVEGSKRWGFGSGASHLISGHSEPHEQLAAATAAFLQRDAAVLFSSGYMANIGLLQALVKKGELIFADKLNHASLIDGGRLCDGEMKRYPHCDTKALEKRLKRSGQNTFVVSDGVFSMDGDLAPLDKLNALCQRYQATLIIDDAHGIGVLGENGGGSAEIFDLNQQQLPVLMATYGKALGGSGAFVAGNQLLVDYLTQFARSYVYTTAMPPAVALANFANLNLQANDCSYRQKLADNIAWFKSQALSLGLELMPSDTAIQPLLLGDSSTTMMVANELKKAGFWVGAVRPPTVPVNTARLRITLSSSHQRAEILSLLRTLATLLKGQHIQNKETL